MSRVASNKTYDESVVERLGYLTEGSNASVRQYPVLLVVGPRLFISPSWLCEFLNKSSHLNMFTCDPLDFGWSYLYGGRLIVWQKVTLLRFGLTLNTRSAKSND